MAGGSRSDKKPETLAHSRSSGAVKISATCRPSFIINPSRLTSLLNVLPPEPLEMPASPVLKSSVFHTPYFSQMSLAFAVSGLPPALLAEDRHAHSPSLGPEHAFFPSE